MTEPLFFATPSELRAWFEANHEILIEASIGYYKKGSGIPSITWAESVDVALCFGWIDGVRNSIDETRYRIRFTPRKTTSTWSAVNINRVPELVEMGLMLPAGLRAFEARKADNSRIYAYEQAEEATLTAEEEALFKTNIPAWEFFQTQAAWYRRTALHQIASAKRAETRHKRLMALIADSEAGRTVASLTQYKK